LDKIIALWFNFIGWTKSLVDPVDVKYIKSKGIRGLDLYFFLILFYPFWFIKSFGFNGVPFPLNLLKKKRKEMVVVHKKPNNLKTQIKSSKSKLKSLKKKKKESLSSGSSVPSVIDLEIKLVSEKRAKLIKKSQNSKKKNDDLKKRKKSLSNNSYLARIKKRDNHILMRTKKISNIEHAMNIFFYVVNRRRLNIDTSNIERIVDLKIYDDFIFLNHGSRENITQDDIFGWLEKHKTTKEFNLFLKDYLIKFGFVFRNKSIGEVLNELYPDIVPY
jgi:hypothetical protein